MLKNRHSPVVVGGILGWAILAVVSQQSAHGEFRALSFHSDIAIQAEGSMVVSETICVRFSSASTGISRYLPKQYWGRHGELRVVDLDAVSVTRNGAPERFNSVGDGYGGIHGDFGIRGSTGTKGVDLPPGDYTYGFKYTVRRAIGFFADHDEWSWNVMGSQWWMPTDEASATVRLPSAVEAASLSLNGALASGKSKTGDCEVEIDAPGVISFFAGRGLDAQEEMTLAVSFPKGMVREPAWGQRLGYTIKDNAGAVAILIGFCTVLLYYLIVFVRVGRDPAPEAIAPRDTPPDGLSPAALRFIWRMGFDSKAFAAALLGAAAKKRLSIRDEHGAFSLVKGSARGEALAPEEESVVRKVFAGAGTVPLTGAARALYEARTAGKTALAAKFEKMYFLSNWGWFVAGGALSVLAVVAALAVLARANPVVVGMSVWVAGWTAGITFMITVIVVQWEYVRAGRWRSLPVALGLPLLFSPWLFGEVFGSAFLISMLPYLVLAGIVAIGLVNALFYHLLKAPTRLGRKTMDEIEGFRIFLGATGAIGAGLAPDAAGRLFAQYLPHAIALEKERSWAQQFADVLSKSGESAGDGGYCPEWYHGDRWKPEDADGFGHRMAGAFVDVVWASSILPPGKKRS